MWPPELPRRSLATCCPCTAIASVVPLRSDNAASGEASARDFAPLESGIDPEGAAAHIIPGREGYALRVSLRSEHPRHALSRLVRRALDEEVIPMGRATEIVGLHRAAMRGWMRRWVA